MYDIQGEWGEDTIRPVERVRAGWGYGGDPRHTVQFRSAAETRQSSETLER